MGKVRKGYTFNMGFFLPLPFVSRNFYPSVYISQFIYFFEFLFGVIQ